MRPIALVGNLVFLFLSGSGLAATHFTEVYRVEEGFRVDDFIVERGRLQELSGAKLFRYESEARHWAKSLEQRNPTEPPVLVSTEGRGDPLWKATNAWSESWEEKYAEWVEETLTTNFFKDNGIAVDCADVPYALRWIFSRINSLPAFATLGGTGTVVTHEVYREAWKNLPTHPDWKKDRRFRAGLDWILDTSFTGTLLKDTFPVEISPSTLKAGLNIHMGSHAEIISHTTKDPGEAPVMIMSSSVPRAVRPLSVRVFMDKKSISADKGGLLRFRWPVKTSSGWKIITRDEMPRYSLEQYRKDLCPDEKHFALCVMKKAGLSIDGAVVMKRLLKNIEENLAFRNSVVVDGAKFCAASDCTPGTTGWEDWSTPGRDGRLLELFENTSELSVTLKQERIFDDWMTSFHPPGRPQGFSLPTFRKNLSRGIISYDPRDSIAARWGDTSEGVLESVLSQLRDGEIYRDEAITNALPCRSDALSCKKNPESLPLYSTLDLDLARRKTLTGLMDFCRENSCPPHNLKIKFRTIWTESPVPWEAEKERRGNADLLKTSHVFVADSVAEAPAGFVILDEKHLYDVKGSQIKISGKSLAYDLSSKTLVAAESTQVNLYDQNLKLVKSFPAPASVQRIILIGENRAFVAGSSSGFLLDLKEKKITLNKNYASYSFSDSVIVLRGNPDLLISPSAVTSLSSLPGTVVSVLSFSRNEVFTVVSDGDEARAGFWNEARFEEVMRANDGYLSLEEINSDYVMVRNSTPLRDFHPTIIFDRQKNPWRPEGFFSAGLSPGKNSRLVLEADFQARVPYLFTGKTVRELPFQFPGTDPVVSASANQLVTMEETVSRVLDFQGKELARSPENVNGYCTSLIWRDQCADSRGDLGFSLYLRKNADPDGYLSWIKYSHRQGPIAYGIRVYTGEREEKSRMKISVGSAMRPYPGVLIWNP